MEAVAGPVEVSTQEGWEHPARALLCVPGRSSQAVSRLTWGCTATSIRQDMQQQLSLLEGCSRVTGCYMSPDTSVPFPSPTSHCSDEFSPSPSLLNMGPAFPQTPELSLMNQHLGSSWSLSLLTALFTDLPFTHCTSHITFIHSSSLPCLYTLYSGLQYPPRLNTVEEI